MFRFLTLELSTAEHRQVRFVEASDVSGSLWLCIVIPYLHLEAFIAMGRVPTLRNKQTKATSSISDMDKLWSRQDDSHYAKATRGNVIYRV